MSNTNTPIKHTPGPWKTHAGTGIITNANGIKLALTVRDVSHCTTTEEMANAALIASAPELKAERDELKEKLKAQEEHGHIIWKDRADIMILNAELKAENEELKKNISAFNKNVFEALRDKEATLRKSHFELQTLNAELLEALKGLVTKCNIMPNSQCAENENPYSVALKAIAKSEGKE